MLVIAVRGTVLVSKTTGVTNVSSEFIRLREGRGSDEGTLTKNVKTTDCSRQLLTFGAFLFVDFIKKIVFVYYLLLVLGLGSISSLYDISIFSL